MRVAFVAAEAVPYRKVGGLADVVGSLPHRLAALGIETSIILPWYPGIPADRAGEVWFRFEGREERVPVGEVDCSGVRVRLLGLPDFHRDRVYGYTDDMQRFVRFSLAAAQAVDAEIVHAHDWQTALLPVLAHCGRVRARSVLTIHNLAHQGCWNPLDLHRWTELPTAYFDLEGLEFYGGSNLLKGGIVFADRVTTVSPRYAAEIQTSAGGKGLDGVLRRHGGKIRGIQNGLDTEVWDPATDPHLAASYDVSDQAGKGRCQEALASELGLAGPILGVVSRLWEQKGVDLVLGALSFILELGYSVAVLGSGRPKLEARLSDVARRVPGRVSFTRGYDEALAHRIYAGSTAFLMPSRFEPCGLSQMIAQRYGTPPIARATGGLIDTIEDGRTGFLFETSHREGLSVGLARFHNHADRPALIEACMRTDVSWDGPARQYRDLYREIAR